MELAYRPGGAVRACFFSPTGTTRTVVSAVADVLARALGALSEPFDFTLPAARSAPPPIGPGDVAVVGLPVFQPLIGMDKEEIVAIARRIGTLETSILPYEDCCTVFTPRHPKTKPVLAEVEAIEAAMDVEGLIADALANTEKVTVRYHDGAR